MPASLPQTAASGIPARHRLRRPGRAAAGLTALVVAVAGLAATGCASFSSALGQREAEVQFQPQTPNSARLRVRAACSHLADVIPEPVPTAGTGAQGAYDVRYKVTNASDAQLARLQQCLQRFPSVVGLNLTSPADS